MKKQDWILNLTYKKYKRKKRKKFFSSKSSTQYVRKHKKERGKILWN